MLLSLLDENIEGLFIVATTNNFQQLDPAITREGRFDRHVPLALPNVLERAHILKVHTQNKLLDSTVDLTKLAKLSYGFSGAKLAAWANEAALCANRENANNITLSHFDQARWFIQTGSLTRLSHEDEPTKKSIAIHETGHALVGHLLNKEIYMVTIFKPKISNGYTEFMSKDETSGKSQLSLLDDICTMLAGRAAEIEFGIPIIGSSDDLRKAKELASYMIEQEGFGKSLLTSFPDQIELILQTQMERARTLIRDNFTKFKNLVDALVTHQELRKNDFIKICNGETLLNVSYKPIASVALQIPPKTVSLFKPKEPNEQEFDSKEMPRKKRAMNELKFPFEDLTLENEKTTEWPFTLTEVAKVLNLEPKYIQKINADSYGGFEIILASDFNDHGLISEKLSLLSQNRVENTYSSSFKKLHIWADGAKDFLQFVKNPTPKPGW